MRSEGVGTGELQPPALMFPHVFEKTNLPDPPPPALLSTSTPTSLVFSPSQSIRLTPPSQPPPILVHRRSYAFVTFCCARVPCPRVSHSSGVTPQDPQSRSTLSRNSWLRQKHSFATSYRDRARHSSPQLRSTSDATAGSPQEVLMPGGDLRRTPAYS